MLDFIVELWKGVHWSYSHFLPTHAIQSVVWYTFQVSEAQKQGIKKLYKIHHVVDKVETENQSHC